tara:strand:- start:40 stop:321 length:282 start_codon:yes stop_codon:yes gene_type:complete
VLTQVTATARAVPGLWPFVLPVFFTIVEDPEADVHADCFSSPPPKGMGLADLLVASAAPLNIRLLRESRSPQSVKKDGITNHATPTNVNQVKF